MFLSVFHTFRTVATNGFSLQPPTFCMLSLSLVIMVWYGDATDNYDVSATDYLLLAANV